MRRVAPTLRDHGNHKTVGVDCAYCSTRFFASTRRSPRPRYCTLRCASLARWDRKREGPLMLLIAKCEAGAGGCLIWKGTHGPRGYGQAYYQGRRMLAHRAMWLATGHALTPGKELCHRCSSKLCVNPNHIYEGTHAENMADHARSGRATNAHAGKTHCAKGHPFDSSNTRIVKGKVPGKTGRQCKACAVERVRAMRALARLDRASGGKG